MLNFVNIYKHYFAMRVGEYYMRFHSKEFKLCGVETNNYMSELWNLDRNDVVLVLKKA
jgi:hypothetical protein